MASHTNAHPPNPATQQRSSRHGGISLAQPGGQHQLGLGNASNYSVRDLWAHTTSTTGSSISAPVPAHGAVMYVVSGGGGTPAGSTSAWRGQGSGRCLDVPSGNQVNGTRPALWDCNGGSNQKWTSTSASELRTPGGKCLEAAGSATANGTVVQIWDCTGGANQQWRLASDGTIVGAASGRCLDVTSAATANGSPVELWDCNGRGNQKWTRA